MRGLLRPWNNIIHVAGRVFVKGAFIPSICQEIMTNAHFAIPTEIVKQTKKF
jgi:hypothetical protein